MVELSHETMSFLSTRIRINDSILCNEPQETTRDRERFLFFAGSKRLPLFASWCQTFAFPPGFIVLLGKFEAFRAHTTTDVNLTKLRLAIFSDLFIQCSNVLCWLFRA